MNKEEIEHLISLKMVPVEGDPEFLKHSHNTLRGIDKTGPRCQLISRLLYSHLQGCICNTLPIPLPKSDVPKLSILENLVIDFHRYSWLP